LARWGGFEPPTP